jgi:hypothetical protein
MDHSQFAAAARVLASMLDESPLRPESAYNTVMADTLSHSERITPSGSARGSVVEMIDAQVARGERTLTALGKKLLEARRRIEQSNIPLLDDAELDREKAERRGGVED